MSLPRWPTSPRLTASAAGIAPVTRTRLLRTCPNRAENEKSGPASGPLFPSLGNPCLLRSCLVGGKPVEQGCENLLGFSDLGHCPRLLLIGR